MAIQLSSIAKYLASRNIKYEESATHVITPFEVETAKGNAEALMVFSTPVDGQVLSVESANFLPSKVVADLISNQKFLLSILNMAWRTPFGGCELGDGSDGPDLRFVVEVPLMDATLTEEQFKAILNGVQSGTKIVCEMALEALGTVESSSSGQDLGQQLKAAAAVLVSDEASVEDKQKAFDFVVAVAKSSDVPADIRASASRLLELIQKAMESSKGNNTQNSPFA